MNTSLHVADIERLAKAGVKIELEHVTPMADPIMHTEARPEAMADAIWQRWHRNKDAISGDVNRFYDRSNVMPFQLLASKHGDKVWVSVHPANFNYEPFQLQDNALVFPSDTLMAMLALWEKEHP